MFPKGQECSRKCLRLHGVNEKFMCDKHNDWGLTLESDSITEGESKVK